VSRDNFITSLSHPARYLGGEVLSIVKNLTLVRFYLALVFPEVYEVAMSHLGIKVLYECLSYRSEIVVERLFAPWLDLMEIMYTEGIEPWSLESGRGLSSFDVIGFSLQYELTYTNFLHILRLAGIPLRRDQRGLCDPLIIAGGPVVVNPEPIADFLDLVVIGEAEELILSLMDLLIQSKDNSWERSALYKKASCIEGIYAPALFVPVYKKNWLIKIESLESSLTKVKRRVVSDFNACLPPIKQILPVIKPVHDRLSIEVARGCTCGCRFCQAGYIYRPVREREPRIIFKAGLTGIMLTGFNELALLSLSTGNYSCIEFLSVALMNVLSNIKVSLSLPSVRIDSLSSELIKQIKRVRKTGFTLAPEVGSEHLRCVINKNLSEKRILDTVGTIFSLGWNLIKLYFMVGLPGEIYEDLISIGRLCSLVADRASSGDKKYKSDHYSSVKPFVHASFGVFVPKPHTPFQWEDQIGLTLIKQRSFLAKNLSDSRIKVKWNSPEQSFLEGIFSRGDRRLSCVLELAVTKGCCFDGWREHLNLSVWLASLVEIGLKPEYFLRVRGLDEVLPWDHIDVGVKKNFFSLERICARIGQYTADCRYGYCYDCGVCDYTVLKPRLTKSVFNVSEICQITSEDSLVFCYFRLKKSGTARFLGHLEMMGQLQRAFSRIGVKVAYSRGFHPHPLLKTDSALPLGIESLVEILEVNLLGYWPTKLLCNYLNKTLPKGLSINDPSYIDHSSKEGAKLMEITYFVRTKVYLKLGLLYFFAQNQDLIIKHDTAKIQCEINLKYVIRSIELVEAGLILVISCDYGWPRLTKILELIFGFHSQEFLKARILKIATQYK